MRFGKVAIVMCVWSISVVKCPKIYIVLPFPFLNLLCFQNNSLPQRDNDELKKDPEDGEVCLALDRTRAPSLAELDSNSSFSSLEEEDTLVDAAQQWPPAARGTRYPSANPTSTLRRMTAAFVCVFAPERRVARLVDELSRDRRSTFGSLVQDFLEKQRQEMEASKSSSAVEILEGLRRFLSQAKSLLLEAGEIEPPIETLVPENEKGKEAS